MKNTLLVIFTSLSICACTVIQEAATPIATPPSTLNDGGKPSTLATLKAELEGLADSDLKVRKGFKRGMDQNALRAFSEELKIVDTANQLRLDEIVKQHGWPEKKDVGAKAAYAAFIVVQHAPSEYMKRYAPMVYEAMERDDLPKPEFARFDDRLRMRYGQPQRYGTQVNTDEKGISTFWQIEDEANVDKRRAEFGYEPLAEHAKRYKVSYVPYAERIAPETQEKPEGKK